MSWRTNRRTGKRFPAPSEVITTPDSKAKIKMYGTVNVYEIDGKAYYRVGKNKYMRAVERD
jgi:hypothetical protein